MSAKRRARTNLIQARSREAARANLTALPPSGPGPFRWLLGVGIVMLIGALGLLAWLATEAFRGVDLSSLFAGESGPRVVAAPGVVLLLASVPLFIGEMLRRSRTDIVPRNVDELRPGRTPRRFASVVFRATNPFWRLVWLVPPAAAYVLLIAVPVWVLEQSGAPGDTARVASDDFWLISGFYGFLAAGFIGIMAASLLKSVTYDRLAVGRMPGRREQRVWHVLCTRWRLDSWLAFVGVGIFGVLPLLWQDAYSGQKPFDDTALLVMSLVAAALSLLAVVVVLLSWRSGDVLGSAVGVYADTDVFIAP